MKARADFVSNSSSSSFILRDEGFFAYFGVSKAEIYAALVDLTGGAERRAKEVADRKAAYEAELAALKNSNSPDPDKARACEEMIRELDEDGLGDFFLYDVADEKEREACRGRWDGHLAGWFAPDEGDYEAWKGFEDTLRWKCGLCNAGEVAAGEEAELVESDYDKAAEKCVDRPVPGGAEFVRFVKEKLGAKTMKDVLHSPDCTLMLHFGENCVYDVRGMSDPGRANESEYGTEEENEKARSSRWESEAYSAERLFEILIGYFEEKGRVDLSDPGLREFWRVPEDDDWFRKAHPGEEYYLEGGRAPTWRDVYDDMLNCSAVMHEG